MAEASPPQQAAHCGNGSILVFLLSLIDIALTEINGRWMKGALQQLARLSALRRGAAPLKVLQTSPARHTCK